MQSTCQNIRCFKLATALLLTVMLGACVAEGPHRHPPPLPPHYYYYWYYPHSGVYYDTDRRVYFYFVDGAWIHSPILPPHLRPHLRNPVKLRMKHARPYVLYNEHRKKYEPHRDVDRLHPGKKLRPPIKGRPIKPPLPPHPLLPRKDKHKDDKGNKSRKHR